MFAQFCSCTEMLIYSTFYSVIQKTSAHLHPLPIKQFISWNFGTHLTIDRGCGPCKSRCCWARLGSCELDSNSCFAQTYNKLNLHGAGAGAAQLLDILTSPPPSTSNISSIDKKCGSVVDHCHFVVKQGKSFHIIHINNRTHHQSSLSHFAQTSNQNLFS